MKTEHKAACDRILSETKGLAGVSYRRLDCGCTQFCGISQAGETLACRYHLSGQPPTRNLEPLVCLACRNDQHFAIERTVDKGIVWADPPPSTERRQQISQQVWGPAEAD